MFIIDAHTHLGYDYVFDYDAVEDELLKATRQHCISVAIVQPNIVRPYLKDHIEIHDRIYAFCSKYPGQFYGMASLNPHFRPADYDKELIRCITKLGFVGVKISPIGHAANPSSKDCMHVFEIANSLHIPVMVHTGTGIPFADPINCVLAAKAFPQTKIILAHAGGEMFFEQALLLAREYENVFLEPSWLSVFLVKTAIESVGAGKIMFSSDIPENIAIELEKYRTAVNDHAALDMIMNGTARNVFNLKSYKENRE